VWIVLKQRPKLPHTPRRQFEWKKPTLIKQSNDQLLKRKCEKNIKRKNEMQPNDLIQMQHAKAN